MWYSVKIILTVDERLNSLEIITKENTVKTNAIYYKYELYKEGSTEKLTKEKLNVKEPL